MLTPLILSNCKRILTVSEFSRQEIAEHYSCDLDKIDVVYNAVNASFKISSDKSIGQKNIYWQYHLPRYIRIFMD